MSFNTFGKCVGKSVRSGIQSCDVAPLLAVRLTYSSQKLDIVLEYENETVFSVDIGDVYQEIETKTEECVKTSAIALGERIADTFLTNMKNPLFFFNQGRSMGLDDNRPRIMPFAQDAKLFVGEMFSFDQETLEKQGITLPPMFKLGLVVKHARYVRLTNKIMSDWNFDKDEALQLAMSNFRERYSEVELEWTPTNIDDVLSLEQLEKEGVFYTGTYYLLSDKKAPRQWVKIPTTGVVICGNDKEAIDEIEYSAQRGRECCDTAFDSTCY